MLIYCNEFKNEVDFLGKITKTLHNPNIIKIILYISVNQLFGHDQSFVRGKRQIKTIYQKAVE